jgi:hypothetical protein
MLAYVHHILEDSDTVESICNIYCIYCMFEGPGTQHTFSGMHHSPISYVGKLDWAFRMRTCSPEPYKRKSLAHLDPSTRGEDD